MYEITKYQENEIAEIVESNFTAGITEFDIDRIVVPGGKSTSWSVVTPEGDTTQEKVEGVVLLARTVRGYWHAKGLGNPPDCSSQDGRTGTGDRFDGNGAGTWACATCPLAMFTDGEPPRCKEKRALFLLMEGDILPVMLSVPPTSLRNFSRYVYSLTRRGVPYFGCVTSFGLDQSKNADGEPFNRITMTMARTLEDEEAAKISAMRGAIVPHLSGRPISADVE